MEIDGGDGAVILDHQPDVSSVQVVREPSAGHVRIILEASTPDMDMSISAPLDAEQAHKLGEMLQAHATLMGSEQPEQTGDADSHHNESEEETE